MEPRKLFQFCPNCGERRSDAPGACPFHCESCDFVYYFNPAIAAAAFVIGPDGRALFIRRAKEPAKGKLAIPGGFVDIGETAEEALHREIREEVNLDPVSTEYLGSYPNEYHYRGVTYPVLDFFFVVHVIATQRAAALDDVESLSWLEPTEVNPEEIAFESIRGALRLYCARLS